MPKDHTSITPGIRTLVTSAANSPEGAVPLCWPGLFSRMNFASASLPSLSSHPWISHPRQGAKASPSVGLATSLSLQPRCTVLSSHLQLPLSASWPHFAFHMSVLNPRSRQPDGFYGLWLSVLCSSPGAKSNSHIHSTNLRGTQD